MHSAPPSPTPPHPFGLSLPKARPAARRDHGRTHAIVLFLAFLLLALASAAHAQTFPKFDDGGVIDAANILTPQQKQALSQKLIAQKQASGRSLVVATIPDLQGYDIADYGYRLGRAWGIGDKDSNGALLIVAPSERKLRIEVGYGLEGILTDALSSQIIRTVIAPRFKAGDMAGGIDAGIDAITTLLALPPDQARAQAAKAEAAARDSKDDGGGIIAFWIILFVVFFILLPMLSRARGGRRYRRGGSAPVVIWGPGLGAGWGSGSGGSGWGGGGFSGGGSFGGGGASGDW